ncbi:MAG: pentapeptide repeat-containing protein [Burkholderiaceae bacterium]|jgi:hypothetical protein|nr:pentapeptide repeat-containing protein [Burkholderiaceae bacterium]
MNTQTPPSDKYGAGLPPAVIIKHHCTDEMLFEYQPTRQEHDSGFALRAALEAGVKSHTNLHGANLSEAYLGGADLSGANLSEAYLSGANLRDAYLNDAHLGHANLNSAYLGGTNLCNTNLRSTNLSRAFLGGANLIGADLGNAYLSGANLNKAYLGHANLIGADLGGAYLNGANLSEAYLGRTNLCEAYLGRANLRDAYLSDDIRLVGERPFLQIGPIGSRNTYLLSCITNRGLRLYTGCFSGTRAEFEQKMAAKHGGNEHEREYRTALALIDAHAEIWMLKAKMAEGQEP